MLSPNTVTFYFKVWIAERIVWELVSIFSVINVSLKVLVQAVESLAQTIALAQKTSCLLSQFICCLTPTEEEWSCIRRALPPQVLSQSQMTFTQAKQAGKRFWEEPLV